MIINEVEYYEGILSQRPIPSPSNKMVSPRFPPPQMVACSGMRDSDSACWKAFDGDSSYHSAWVTPQVGHTTASVSSKSFSTTKLAIPQWLLLDLGVGRHTYSPLSALRIVCGIRDNITDTNTTSYKHLPVGCPKVFSLLGSYDNHAYQIIRKFDLRPYGTTPTNHYPPGTRGKTFQFHWENSIGRPNGQRCGSCDSGPLFQCATAGYDSSCASSYCEQDVCASLPACPAGQYRNGLTHNVGGQDATVDVTRGAIATGLPISKCDLCPAGTWVCVFVCVCV